MNVEARCALEAKIIRNLVTRAVAWGNKVSVSYGDGDWGVKLSTNVAEIMKAIHACDEEWLVIRNEHNVRVGTVLLVYGNDGYDVMCDWNTNPTMDALVEPTMEYAAKFE